LRLLLDPGTADAAEERRVEARRAVVGGGADAAFERGERRVPGLSDGVALLPRIAQPPLQRVERMACGLRLNPI
jgi:hypothetical protein